MFKLIRLSVLLAVCLMASAWQSHAAMTVYPLPNIFKGVNMIALSEIEESLLRAFSLQQGLEPSQIELQILGHEKGVRVDLEAPSYEMQVSNLDVNSRTRQFGSDLVFSTPDGQVEKIEISGRFEEVIQVPVLASRLPAKHIITEDDIVFENIATHRLNDHFVREQDFLIGKMLRRSAPVGRPIRARDVMEPLVVERNSSVTMVYQTPYMTIRTLAIALEDGSKGDVIRVRNASSSRIVQATIEDESMVRVGQYKGEEVL